MKISDLVEQLAGIRQQQGDIVVAIESLTNWSFRIGLQVEDDRDGDKKIVLITS